MFDFLQNLFGPKKQQIISPVPQSDSPGGYNDPTQLGLNYYYQREGMNTNQAQAIPAQAAQQPQGFDGNAIGQALSLLVNPKGQQAEAEELPQPQSGDNYLQKASQIFTKYGVPAAVGLGIWAMEGRGKTINPNNPFNIGAYDTNPQNALAYHFKDALEGTEEAAKFLAGKSEFQTPQVQKVFKMALDQFNKDGNQAKYLKSIAPVYSTNPAYAKTIMQTPEYQQYAKK